MTPEMLSYFSEELTRNASQGVRNIVSDVELLKGELSESWEEGDLQYATAYLRWRAIDYVVRARALAGRPRLRRQRRPAHARSRPRRCGPSSAAAAADGCSPRSSRSDPQRSLDRQSCPREGANSVHPGLVLDALGFNPRPREGETCHPPGTRAW